MFFRQLRLLTFSKTHETFEKFLQAQAKEDPSAVQILDSLQLRYFSPTELLRLFGFQRRDSEDDFKWPSELSSKSKYRLIGNSVNVDVVAKLVQFLLQWSRIDRFGLYILHTLCRTHIASYCPPTFQPLWAKHIFPSVVMSTSMINRLRANPKKVIFLLPLMVIC